MRASMVLPRPAKTGRHAAIIAAVILVTGDPEPGMRFLGFRFRVAGWALPKSLCSLQTVALVPIWLPYRVGWAYLTGLLISAAIAAGAWVMAESLSPSRGIGRVS